MEICKQSAVHQKPALPPILWVTLANPVSLSFNIYKMEIKGSTLKDLGEGNGNPLQYSYLENSMDRGAWWATVHGVKRAGHD